MPESSFRRVAVDSEPALIVLAPSPAVAAQRIAARDKVLTDDWSFLDEALRVELAREGRWIDNSDLDLDRTVAAVLAVG